jgi:hypothetical protein
MGEKQMSNRWRSTRVAAGLLALACCVFLPAARSAGQAAGEGKTYPRRVLLIRHAEKPPDEDDSAHLSPEGKKRAERLHRLFEATEERPRPFRTPDYVFATANSKNSHRPVETVTPLARRLKLDVDSRYRDEDFAKLAHAIFHDPKYRGKTVLICWHHGTLPQLAGRLKAADAPDAWDKKVFDRVWEITYGEQGQATFHDRPQRLLAGDSTK